MTAKYSGSLTGEPLMLHETKIVANLFLKGKTDFEIKNEILENNYFEYKTKKSISKRVSSILRRLKKIDSELIQFIIDDISGDGKIVIIYAISLENRLISELISEIIYQKFRIKEFEFDKKIIQKFIDEKGELNQKVGSFKSYTRYRLSVSIYNILKDADIIFVKEKKSFLKPARVSYTLKKVFEKKGEEIFLKNIGVYI